MLGIPENFIGLGTRLFKWLGSFWSSVYRDPDFIRYIQVARALRISQLYLDILEGISLRDRNKAPVFHRERWFPLVIRKSTMNTGVINMARVLSDNRTVLGEQTDPIYPPGTVINIGGTTRYSGISTFRIDNTTPEIATAITDNIVEPHVILRRGVDFAIEEDSICISDRYSPFGENSPFPQLDINDGEDTETVLWACNAEIDTGYTYDYTGYAVGMPGETSETYSRLVNTAWDLSSDGSLRRDVERYLAALCDTPTVLTEGETVEDVQSLESGTVIVTDKNTYSIPPGAVIRASIRRGAVLHMGELLDETVHVYPFITDTSPEKIHVYSESYGELEKDIPVLDLPPGMFLSSLGNGFSVGWEYEDIVCNGFDINGNPKLSFRLNGSDDDNDKYWNTVWNECEKRGVSVASCFSRYIYDTIFSPGKVCGALQPIRFFLENATGPNTVLATVTSSGFGSDSRLHESRYYRKLRLCIPGPVHLFIVERMGVTDEYVDLGDPVNSEEDAELSVYSTAESSAGKGCHGLSYTDMAVNCRWIPSCPGDHIQ